MKILVTGGAGFIGSNFLRMMVPRHPEHSFVNADKLTYAANLRNLESVEDASNYALEVVDIADADALGGVFERCEPDAVVHFAAESHVDRSILGPGEFVRTNIHGTFNLLECFRAQAATGRGTLFQHVSTDEVYGSLGDTGLFTETTRYDPSSPYSASKAASDHLVTAYGRTYGLPIKITNCSNNYGPYQFPEKLIPLMVLNALSRKPLPVYGKGLNVRDWLYVEDHCEAIWSVIDKGAMGATYNIGGRCEMRNVDVVDRICAEVSDQTGSRLEELTGLITYVQDRPGHDLRYAIDASKIADECGWVPQHTFDSGLRNTVRWYIENTKWTEEVQSGDYRKWMEENYGARLSD
jgi:dTDP-glucose 4,6-dehydratase